MEKDKNYIINNIELMEEWNWEKNNGINPKNLVIGSNKKVWWICKHGHEWEAIISSRSRGSKCPYCVGQKAITGVNDLKTLCPELLKEWNYERNNELGIFPDQIKTGSHKKVFWKCSKCGFEWQTEVKHRTRKDGKASGCSQCKREKLSKYHSTPLKGVNDLESCYPKIAKEWNFDRNNLLPSQVLKSSSLVVWWKCSVCGNEWRTSIHCRTSKKNRMSNMLC